MSGVRTTGIGSLPFTDREAALAHVFARYDVPFYPQLPRLGAGAPLMMREVLPQAQRGTALLTQLRGEPGLAGFAGFDAFLARATGLVKMQLAGPLSLAAWLAADNPELPGAELTELCWLWCERLTRSLAGLLPAGAWLVWDDALLARAGPEPARRFHDLRATLPARLGLHSCLDGEAAPVLQRFRGALLALDMNVVTFAGAETALSEHYAAGGGVIFGVFDTRLPQLDVAAGLRRARRAIELAGGAELGLSGGCGTGLRPQAYEELLAGSLAMARALPRP